jgi:hypothetical protein
VLDNRALIASLLAFWLAVGPVVSAWAQSAGKPCESMGMSTPADDCCGDTMDRASCLDGCLGASSTIAAPATQVSTLHIPAVPVAPTPLRQAGILAPPDSAPPKLPVS